MANLTGRPIYQKTSKPAQKPKRMRQVSEKRAAYRKSDEGELAQIFMGLIHQLPCWICYIYGLDQKSRTRGHHCMDGVSRHDLKIIPLCGGHHNREDADNSKVSYHNQKDTFRREYGGDTCHLDAVRKAVLQMVDEKTHDRLIAAFLEADAGK